MATIDLESVWEEYGLDALQEGLGRLFPDYSISLKELLGRLAGGDLTGAFSGLLQAVFGGAASQLAGMRNILIWLLVLGIVSAVMSHFVEIFDRHQIADLSFYFMYLLLTAVLLRCFLQAAGTAEETLRNVIDFMKLLIPTYLLSVGVASGALTVSAYYQLLLFIIYGIENILIAGILPFIYAYCLLAVVNGVWTEGKLALLTELIGKAVRAVLKAAIGVVTGVGIVQSVLAPVTDTVNKSALQKAVAAIPGIGDAADGVIEIVIGSAVVIKNSIGVAVLLLLIVLCALPMLRILLIGCMLKAAAALMGIVSDRRITSVTDRVGEGSLLLLRTVGTALLLFAITISMMAASTNRGI